MHGGQTNIDKPSLVLLWTFYPVFDCLLMLGTAPNSFHVFTMAETFKMVPSTR